MRREARPFRLCGAWVLDGSPAGPGTAWARNAARQGQDALQPGQGATGGRGGTGRCQSRRLAQRRLGLGHAEDGGPLVSLEAGDDPEVVPQVLPGTRQVMFQRDAEVGTVRSGADAREHEDLGAVDRAAAEDDFARLFFRRAAETDEGHAGGAASSPRSGALRPGRRAACRCGGRRGRSPRTASRSG